MERADHFSPQDYPRWRRQKLWDPGRAPRRVTKGNPRPRQTNSRPFGKFLPRRRGTKAARQTIRERNARIAKGAARFVINDEAFAARVVTEKINSGRRSLDGGCAFAAARRARRAESHGASGCRNAKGRRRGRARPRRRTR